MTVKPSTHSPKSLPPVVTLIAAVLFGTPPVAGAQPAADQLHARAVESFRQGRFPEAYGRFVDLANAGHARSARYALWMCENGMLLFGKDWDCAPHEVEDWARTAGVAQPLISPPKYETPRLVVAQPMRRGQVVTSRLSRPTGQPVKSCGKRAKVGRVVVL
jgi:hypothetical protein